MYPQPDVTVPVNDTLCPLCNVLATEYDVHGPVRMFTPVVACKVAPDLGVNAPASDSTFAS